MPSAPPASSNLTALLNRYSSDVQETAYAARGFLLSILPGAIEIVDGKDRVIAYGYGKGYRDLICTLILSESEVKLGLVGGANLPDPRHLMSGSGKVHRYVSLASPKDLLRPGLKTLVATALSTWRQRTEGGA